MVVIVVWRHERRADQVKRDSSGAWGTL